MEKKRSVGVTVCGIVTIIFGFLLLLFSVRFFLWLLETIYFIFRVKGSNLAIVFRSFIKMIPNLIVVVVGIGYLVSGIGILKLSLLARRTTLFLSAVFILLYLTQFVSSSSTGSDPTTVGLMMYAPILILPLSFIIFFTRPKVKEQFKKEEIPNA